MAARVSHHGIAHLSPVSVTASVDNLCGEGLSASAAVGSGGCGQKLARASAMSCGLGYATPALSTALTRVIPSLPDAPPRGVRGDSSGRSDKVGVLVARRRGGNRRCGVCRKSAVLGTFPPHGRAANRCSMPSWDCFTGARPHPSPPHLLRCRPKDPHRCTIPGMEVLPKPSALPVPFQARPTGEWNGTPCKTPEGQPKKKMVSDIVAQRLAEALVTEHATEHAIWTAT